MNKLFVRGLIFLGVVSLVLGNFIAIGAKTSYAKDLIIEGNDAGLEIIPDSTKLFDLSNLNPGDTKEARITIKNSYIATYELFMRAEKIKSSSRDEEGDLFNQLILTVYLGDREVYFGTMKDFAISNISLGEFKPGDIGVLRAIIHLPGPETGNEYQGAILDTRWIFTGQLDEAFLEEEEEEPGVEVPEKDPPKKIIDKDTFLPKTGEIVPMTLYGSGALLIALGIAINRRRKK